MNTHRHSSTCHRLRVPLFGTLLTLAMFALPVLSRAQSGTPTVRFTTDDKVQITYTDPAATIYYTTDGTTPTASSTEYTGAFIPDDDLTTVKAIAVGPSDSYTTAAVTFSTPLLPGASHTYLLQSLQNAQAANFYVHPGLTRDGYNNPNTFSVTTTSIPRPTMLWYFKATDDDIDGNQCFYIVNKSTGRYVYCDGTNSGTNNGVGMHEPDVFEAAADKTPYKFSIPYTSMSPGGYYIRPKSTGDANKALNKNQGNNGWNPFNLNNVAAGMIGYATWNIIPDFEQQKYATTTPFAVSNGTETHYYKIESADASGYYIIPNDGASATTSNTDDDENSVWYFEEAGTVDWITFYRVVNAVTGKYLYYNGSTDYASTKENALTTVAPTDDDRTLFYFAPTMTAAKYYFMPKVLDGLTWNKYMTIQRNGANPLRVLHGRDENNRKWGFVAATHKCATPTVDFDDDICRITVVNHAPGSKIYCFGYDSEPAPDLIPANATLYEGPFIATHTHYKFIATRNSTDFSDKSDAAALTIDVVCRCATPTISFNYITGNATISCPTPGSEIHYTTDGVTTPTAEHTLFSAPIHLTTTTTIRAIAVKAGADNSDVATLTITQAATPTIQDNGSNAISITSATDGVTIYYTTDGSDPVVGVNEYTAPLQDGASSKTIKAIATKEGMITSTVGSGSVTLQCAPPVIAHSGNDGFTFTCTLPTSGGIIYYTTDGSTTPTTSTPTHTTPGSKVSSALPVTVKAIAVADGYYPSEVATAIIRPGLEGSGTESDPYIIIDQYDVSNFIEKANSAEGASAHYKVTATDPLDFSTTDPVTQAFSGTFDGDHHIITGLQHALFNTVSGGTVKNVRLDGVSISGGTDAGAFCNLANGSSKFYNCGVLGGSVGGSGNVGGLVGLVESGSSVRVVNCYNYATVSGGDYAGGIVGRNQGTVGSTRIAMCMMYGDMTSGTHRSPVYAGNHVSNVQNYTEYNYYRSQADLTYTDYNDQLAIGKDEFLTRFPFYRHILNTHRQLAAYYLFGTTGQGVGDITEAQVAEIGHWALLPDVANYPIVEPWQSNTHRTTVDIAANLPATTDAYAGKLLTDMGTSGYLKVNVTVNDKSFTTQLPITDMDTLRYDFTWGKVVLPFANEYSGWTRDYSKACTGWEITAISGGTSGTFANYNVADRHCTAKDLYSNSDYIFAQGGNYTVPYGVTEISIKAHFANAYYLSDPSYEVGYNASYVDATPLGGSVQATYHGQTVYTDISTLVAALGDSKNPHDQAIVLVGNYHYRVTSNKNVHFNTGKACSIMSVDEDANQEPDYGWYMGNTYGRIAVPPLRFDFVPIIELGMSSRVAGSNAYPGVGIWHTRGWFEFTETSLSNSYQCEINDQAFTDNDNGRGNNRWIANSGRFVQIVRARDGDCQKLSYIQIGGNAYVQELFPGSHTDNARKNTIVPIVVTGGEIEECYMSGYKTGGKLLGDMIRFWCTGGRMHKWLGAYLEEPQTAGLTAKIDHAIFRRFFGGGTSEAARVKGDIDITIDNSLVDFYCGGPEFGDMVSGKSLTTHATGTTFGVYYGAGYGGASTTYNREAQNPSDNISAATYTYPLGFSYYTDNRLTVKNDYGIGSCHKFEFIYNSNGSSLVSRFYTGYVQFSLATTGNVTNVLTDCTILHSFYGAGCQGKVDGTVTSTLTGCTVGESVFGGGYKATSNEVSVYPTTQPTYSVFTRETGLFSDFGTVTPETYTWVRGTAAGSDPSAHTLTTTVDMSTLGTVTGKITLTIDGGTVGGSVYGGGNESPSNSDTDVTLQGTATIGGDVFGGGNKAVVGGSTHVTIK